MKAKLAKRTVALVLCFLMLAIIPIESVGAYVQYEQGSNATPTIVVLGYDNNALYADPETKTPERQFPPDVNSDYLFLKYLNTYVGLIRQYEPTKATLAIFPEVKSWFDGIRCNHNGTSQLNVGPLSRNGEPLQKYENNKDLVDKIAGDLGKMVAEQIGSQNTYIFSYDWRLSPLYAAKELNDLVKQIKADRGVSKVSILSEGMGGIIASTYMTIYASLNNYADIKNYLTINSAAMGSTLFGDIYTGKIDADPNGLVRYSNDVPQNIIMSAVMQGVNHILRKPTSQGQMTWAMHVDRYLHLEGQLTVIYNVYMRDILNKIPGLWAMVPYDTYDEALTFMYPAGSDWHEEIHEDLLKDLNEYHAIQKLAPDTLMYAKEAGVNVSVVSNYGMQTIPLTKHATVESGDGVVDTRYSSFGAYTAFLNNKWVGRGLYKQVCQDGHDHRNKAQNITLGYSVDASTCALPENTWFVYGMTGKQWNYDSDTHYYLIDYLLNSDEQRTVWDSYYYPQFMTYNKFAVPGIIYSRSQKEAKRFNLKGDANLDGVITAADARLALRHSAKLTVLTRAAFRNADINGDGKINAAVARKILRVSAQLEKFD